MSNNRTTAQWKQMDASRHLHPFTDFNDYQKNHGRIIERAEHIYIYDTDGKKMLDAMSGLWCCSLGYSQPEIAEAVQAQFQQLPYYNNFFPVQQYSSRGISRQAGKNDTRTIYSCLLY